MPLLGFHPPRIPLAFRAAFAEFRGPVMTGLRSLLVVLLAAISMAAPAHLHAISTVVVDAGHGGIDRGGQPGQKNQEKIYTLAVAQKLAAKLRDAGFRVVMTRSDDSFIGLGTRCAIANGQRDAVFVSVHFNAAPRTTATGVETYYYSGKSSGLAAACHREVLRVMGTEDRHIRQRGFYVLRHTNIPAVLIESGFLTNAAEFRRISSPAFQDQLAGGMARAIISKYK
jgi:N-acetylmuramoyl-L-alanine amidase